MVTNTFSPRRELPPEVCPGVPEQGLYCIRYLYPGLFPIVYSHSVGCLTDVRLRQNEPENSNPSYPTCLTSASQEAQIGTALRSLLNNSGFSSVKIIAYDHNWNDAGGYPIQVVRS